MKDIWDYYTLTWLLDDIAGGLPTDPRLIDAWQAANWSHQAKLLPDDPRSPEEATQRTLADLAGIPEEKGWTTFARDGAGHLAIEGRQVKAALKEAANVMKPLIPVGGKTIALRSRLAERVFVVERLLPFEPHKTEPDDTIERAIHVMTAQGPRDALKRTDICKEVSVTCTLKVLRDKLFTEEVLHTLLAFATANGLGADRSQGFGQGDYRLSAASAKH